MSASGTGWELGICGGGHRALSVAYLLMRVVKLCILVPWVAISLRALFLLCRLLSASLSEWFRDLISEPCPYKLQARLRDLPGRIVLVHIGHITEIGSRQLDHYVSRTPNQHTRNMVSNLAFCTLGMFIIGCS